MAVPLLSFGGEFLHACLGSYELNLVYEHQNVVRETELYRGELVAVLRCHFFLDDLARAATTLLDDANEI